MPLAPLAAAPPDAGASRAPLGPKLNPPASRIGQVMREAICDRVCNAPAARLVMVCAPAGFGKTTAMSQCRQRLAEQGVATAWLTLDTQDNDIARFLAGLDAAVHRLGGAGLAPLGAAALSSGEWALALMERLGAMTLPFALFLDDLELVQDAGVLALVRELIERLPRGGQLVMGSRTLPELPLARLRARGQLVDVNAGHLRFSRGETARFFARGTVGELPLDAVARLHDKTEGWVAALWLASLALERPQGRGDFIERFSGSHLALADYLAEDVLAGMPPELKAFLLRTSLLKHLHPALCEALLPGVDAVAILRRLEAANVFLSPIDGEPGTWRYHSLFASFLRGQLEREAPQELGPLHQAASAWYEAQERPVPAIDHALEGGDVERALGLLERHAMPLLKQGRLRLLARWFAGLAEAALRDHPLLQVVYLWALCFTAGPVEAMARLQATGLRQSLDPAVRAHVGALEPTLLGMMDRHEEAYACGRVLVAALPSGEPFADSVVANVMADASTVLGRYPEARALLDAVRRAQGAGGSAFSQMYSESVDGIIDLLEGRLRQASARFRLAVSTTPADNHARASGNAWAGLLHAGTMYEGNDLEQAARLLHVYLPLARDVGLPDHVILGHVMLSRIAMCRREPLHAMNMLAELEALGHQRALPRVVASARLERARIALLQGDPEGADTELQRADEPALWRRVSAQCHLANDVETLQISRLRRDVLLAPARAALPAIEREIAIATAATRQRRVLVLRLLQAMATWRAGDVAAACAMAMPLMKVCAREGFVRLVVDEGPLAGELVSALAAREQEALRRDPILADHLGRLVRAFGDEAGPPPPVLPEPLTQQELRVLRLVSEGLSNDALGDRLGISKSTVRTHLRNISAKLEARNRTQAVAIARRLGAIP